MLRFWERVVDPELLPFERLFFGVVGLVAQGTPGPRGPARNADRTLAPDAVAMAGRLWQHPHPAGLRLGVAVVRGLPLDLEEGERGSSA